MPKGTRVYIERGAKRAFASAADWPGWCRSGKDEESLAHEAEPVRLGARNRNEQVAGPDLAAVGSHTGDFDGGDTRVEFAILVNEFG